MHVVNFSYKFSILHVLIKTVDHAVRFQKTLSTTLETAGKV